jgi:hypothetical protein
MLYMTVFTYDPEKRDAIIKRRAEKGALVRAGVKLLGEWSSLGGGRIFRLVEGEDPVALHAATMAWNDLGKIEIYPVMPVEEIFKILAGKK